MRYVPGRVAGPTTEVVAYAPELAVGPRLTLLANGEIVLLTTAELRSAIAAGGAP